MSSLHDRLYNHEVTPPGHTWDKIATALDESALENKFPQVLYHMEVAPPASAWEKIDESFTTTIQKQTAPVRRLRPVLRYAAAAILVGLLAFSIIKLTLNNDNSGSLPGPTANKPADTNTSVKTNNLPEPVTGNELASQRPEEQEKPAAVKTIRRDQPVQRKTSQKSMKASFQSNEFDTELSRSIYAYADHVPDISDRYVMLLTPDGNIIRMAKKWSNLVCCVSGEEQDPGCKNQIKKWQEKIASSSIAPAPGNFMDILGLVNSLNENSGL